MHCNFSAKGCKVNSKPSFEKKKPPGYATLQPTSPSPEEGHFCSLKQ